MNSLGGIDIGDLILVRPLNPPQQVTTKTACDGSLIAYEKDLLYSPLSLVGGDNWGLLTSSQIDTFTNMASVKGGIYELIYDSVYYTVRFMKEDSAISAEMINPHLIKNKIKYKNVTIKLMEIE